MKDKTFKNLVITICVFAVIFFVLFLTLCGTQGIAENLNDSSLPNEGLSSWMSLINDDTLATNLVIPGAHDSGTYTTGWYAETQFKTIKELLECGTRYFDIRVSKKGNALRIFHGPIKGVDFIPIIEDIAAFLDANPSEFLILDFQHFDGGSQSDVIALIESNLNGKLVKKDASLSEIDYVKSLKLSDVRGKAIIYWGVEDDNLSKDYVFKRNDDNGERANATMQSFYKTSLNIKSSKKYINEALPTYIDMFKESNGGFFVLQGQLTDPILIIGPKYREYTHIKNMNKYVESLNDSDELNNINIIMRDFITPSKNALTLKLNLSKGLVKSDQIDAYTNIVLNPNK